MLTCATCGGLVLAGCREVPGADGFVRAEARPDASVRTVAYHRRRECAGVEVGRVWNACGPATTLAAAAAMAATPGSPPAATPVPVPAAATQLAAIPVPVPAIDGAVAPRPTRLPVPLPPLAEPPLPSAPPEAQPPQPAGLPRAA